MPLFSVHDDGSTVLESLVDSFNLIKLAMKIKAPQWFRDLFPEVATDSKVSPFFLINTFGIFVMLALILGFAIFLKTFELWCKAREWRRMKAFLKNIHSVTLFAAFVLFANSINVIPSFYIKQFQELNLDNLWAKVSFGLSILVIVLFLILIGYIIYLVNNIPVKGFRHYVKQWKYCELLFSGFEEKSFFTRSFYVFYILILLCSSTSSSLFGEYSLKNGIVQLVISSATILYIYLSQPLRKKINNAQLLSLDLVNMALYGYVVWLGINGSTTKGDDVLRIIKLVAKGLVVIFLVIKLIKEIHDIRVLMIQELRKSKLSWLNLLHIFIQQAGMGFENAKVPKYYSEHVPDSQDDETNLSSAQLPQGKYKSWKN